MSILQDGMASGPSLSLVGTRHNQAAFRWRIMQARQKLGFTATLVIGKLPISFA
jgi:hypothetical protein